MLIECHFVHGKAFLNAIKLRGADLVRKRAIYVKAEELVGT
jgi:hypothetical protein